MEEERNVLLELRGLILAMNSQSQTPREVEGTKDVRAREDCVIKDRKMVKDSIYLHKVGIQNVVVDYRLL